MICADTQKYPRRSIDKITTYETMRTIFQVYRRITEGCAAFIVKPIVYNHVIITISYASTPEPDAVTSENKTIVTDRNISHLLPNEIYRINVDMIGIVYKNITSNYAPIITATNG